MSLPPRYSNFLAFLGDPSRPQLSANALAPRAHFDTFHASGDSARFPLDGLWRFCWCESPLDAPAGFEGVDYLESGHPENENEKEKGDSIPDHRRSWSDLEVPSCWQMPIHSGDGENARWVDSFPGRHFNNYLSIG